ncbi:MAG: DJ-1/PfpI family protein [Spirochaetaceae bacterium]|jgi:4-methyl-5(b-hydroxyethyl)-thiazole monophosphate biosynthesis|nr:DJ-1/PfpI family protein [Spirochaetaceae bacterium]
MPKKAFVFLADGFEEVEAITPIDYLRRAGIEVITVSISKEKIVFGAHQIPVVADSLIFDIHTDEADCLVLPGGIPGAPNLAASQELDLIIRDYNARGRVIAAICAAPAVVLAPKGLLQGRNFTCYPGLEKEVKNSEWKNDKVVIDNHIITSRGPGTAAYFAFAIIEKLIDKEAAQKIKDAVISV